MALPIFEPPTDLIVEGNSMTFGHKITLTNGASGLTLDVVVERGNLGDSTLALSLRDSDSKNGGVLLGALRLTIEIPKNQVTVAPSWGPKWGPIGRFYQGQRDTPWNKPALPKSNFKRHLRTSTHTRIRPRLGPHNP